MDSITFLAFLNLLMCSDPWPASEHDKAVLENFAKEHAQRMGFQDWIEAYHEL